MEKLGGGNIPWPDVDDGSTCGLYLGGDAQPASRVRLFRSIIVDTSDSNVQKYCGISKNLGHPTEQGDVRDLYGERRWFGGFSQPPMAGCFSTHAAMAAASKPIP
jgi:hypothetical protein